MRDRRSGHQNLRITVATAVLTLSVLAGLATATPALAVAPAADLATLGVVPPEPAPAPVVADHPLAPRLIDASVVVVASPAPAPAPVIVSQPAAAAAPTDAPGRAAESVDIGEADTVEREPDAATATIRVEVPATDAADRTVTVRHPDGTVLAGPFQVDGHGIVVHDLVAGDVDLYVEDLWHGGGSTLARTPTTLVAGRTHVARCDGGSLECTVD